MQDEEGLDQDLMVEVWRIASRTVLDRPWLLATWSDNTPNIPHVVVHDGTYGAALHFDHEDGPYWAGGFTRRLTWADLSSDEPDEWETGWGNRDPSRKRKNRAATYALISALVARWVISKALWVARPAPMIGESPDSVFALTEQFPTASESVDHYLEVMERELEESEANGVDAYWHEPFWLVRRDGEPRLLIDEAGEVHLPVTVDHQGTSIRARAGMNLTDILKHGDGATDLAARGYSFDLRYALDNGGGPEEFAELCDRGTAAVIFDLEPYVEPTEESAVKADDVDERDAEPVKSPLLNYDEIAEAGGFHLVASATFQRLLEILDRATRGDDPSAIMDLHIAGAIAWKYAGHPSLDELSEDLQRQAAQSWRETRRLLFRDDEMKQGGPMNRYTPDPVRSLAPDEVFVFGSNAAGRHGGGAARAAIAFGAVWGEGHGLHGQTYAIDTMSGVEVLAAEASAFLAFAGEHAELMFLLTPVGCGIAGYSEAEVAPMFAGATSNVVMPESFARVLGT